MHSFYFFTFLKFYFIFKFYIIVLVLPNIKMSPPQVYMCSPSCTLLPPPSPYPPSGSSQCTSPKHPVSSIKPGLATHFIHDILHVSLPFSQFFPPSPSATESVRLLFIYTFEQMVELPEKSRPLFLSDYWIFVDMFITTPPKLFFFIVATLCGLWDFSSPTGDWTRALGS